MDIKAGGNAADMHGSPPPATVEPASAVAATSNAGAGLPRMTRPSRLSPSLVQNGPSSPPHGPLPLAAQQQQSHHAGHAGPLQHAEAIPTQQMQSQHVQVSR